MGTFSTFEIKLVILILLESDKNRDGALKHVKVFDKPQYT